MPGVGRGPTSPHPRRQFLLQPALFLRCIRDCHNPSPYIRTYRLRHRLDLPDAREAAVLRCPPVKHHARVRRHLQLRLAHWVFFLQCREQQGGSSPHLDESIALGSPRHLAAWLSLDFGMGWVPRYRSIRDAPKPMSFRIRQRADFFCLGLDRAPHAPTTRVSLDILTTVDRRPSFLFGPLERPTWKRRSGDSSTARLSRSRG